MVSHSSDDVTGSIGHPYFSDSLSPEDRRRAIAAMTTALDPQGSGSTVAWDNPDSGVKGNFVPMGNAYPDNDLVCRDFAAELTLKTGDRSMHGTACADKSGHWTITDAKPWKKI